MFQNRKVIACVPSGRRHYMRIGLPYLVSDPIIDEVHLWLNTDVPQDLAWLELAAMHYGNVKLIDGPGKLQKSQARDGHTQFNNGVARFFRLCTETGTTYLKLDDDLVWFCDGFAASMCEAVQRQPEPCFALGNAVNVPHFSYLHHRKGLLGHHDRTIYDNPRCHATFMDGAFAIHIHRQFQQACAQQRTDDWKVDDHDVGPGHTRIGAMCWRGETFARFGGNVQEFGDEPDLTVRVPQLLQLPIRYAGHALCAHHSFGHQQAVVDAQIDILPTYEQISRHRNGEPL